MPQRKGKKQTIRKIIRDEIYKVAETKFYFNQPTAGVIADFNAPFLVPLTNIGIGDTQQTRTGNQIVATGLYAKGYFTLADSTNIIRMAVVIPRDPSVTTLSGYAPYSEIDRDSFTVLYDKLFMLEAGAKTNVPFEIKKSFKRGGRKGMTVQYNATTGLDCTRNRAFVYIVSDSSAIAHPTVAGHFKLYFKDI